jgi:hypothetical protein
MLHTEYTRALITWKYEFNEWRHDELLKHVVERTGHRWRSQVLDQRA